MPSALVSVVVDAVEPERLARFWGGLLGRDVREDEDGIWVVSPESRSGTKQFALDFQPSDEPRRGPNQVHFHVTSTSRDDMEARIAAALELGGQHIDVGQTPDEGHVVLADPEGNEFCVIEPGNTYLADTDLLGELACDGSRACGEFWSEALGWPLVWDEGDETAIQSPAGGAKVAWGGPPVAPKLGKNRINLDIAPPVGADQQLEVERLIGLGARRHDIGQDGSDSGIDWVVMADPDGNEFCLLTPR